MTVEIKVTEDSKIQNYEGHMVSLIKLTHQKDANLILTQKCFTIAIKTIQLLARIIIIKHDEFINANFSRKIFFETNNLFAIRGKNPFLFHWVKKRNSIASNIRTRRNIATK